MNKSFSYSRTLNYIELQCHSHYKRLLLAGAALCGILAFAGANILKIGKTWTPSHESINDQILGVFLGSYSILAIISVGNAFPDFRLKKTAMRYLMLPVSNWERFIGEYFLRFILFTLVYPLVFYGVMNGAIYFLSFLKANYEYQFYWLTDSRIYQRFAKDDYTPMLLPLIIQLVHLAVLYLMLGASCFERFALVKTLAALSGMAAYVVFFGVLVIKFKMLPHYYLGRNIPAFLATVPDTAKQAILWLNIALAIAQALLIASCYYKLKEKEA